MTQPYQQRVLDERQQLVERLTALNLFFNSTYFDALDISEQDRLLQQSQWMTGYRMTLDQRIAHFKDA